MDKPTNMDNARGGRMVRCALRDEGTEVGVFVRQCRPSELESWNRLDVIGSELARVAMVCKMEVPGQPVKEWPAATVDAIDALTQESYKELIAEDLRQNFTAASDQKIRKIERALANVEAMKVANPGFALEMEKRIETVLASQFPNLSPMPSAGGVSPGSVPGTD
jgi:hypothetical protein